MEANESPKIKVVEGSRQLGISKGEHGTILSIQELGADYSYTVKLVIQFNSKKLVLFARHINRVREDSFNLNNGNPLKKIKVKRLPIG